MSACCPMGSRAETSRGCSSGSAALSSTTACMAAGSAIGCSRNQNSLIAGRQAAKWQHRYALYCRVSRGVNSCWIYAVATPALTNQL